MNKYKQTPYTYLIGWRNHDIWYYGSRRGNKETPEHDLWIKYFTSSTHVKDFSLLNGPPDVIRIHKTFDSCRECYLYEKKFLKRVKAKNSSRWLNKSVNNWDVEKQPRVGWHHSEETRLKISKSNKGKHKSGHPCSEAHKSRLSSLMKDRWTPEERQKQKERAIDNEIHKYFHSPQAREKQKQTMKQYRLDHPDYMKKTPEMKQKMSAARLKFLQENEPHRHTEDSKKKISESAKRAWTPERKLAASLRTKAQHAARRENHSIR